MTSTLLGALERRINRTFSNVTNVQRQIVELPDRAKKTQLSLESFEKILLDLNKAAFDAIQDASMLIGSIRELEGTPDNADALADVLLMLQRLDYLQAVAHIDLARAMENLIPDMAEFAVRELASYESGRERLRIYREAIEKVEREKGWIDEPGPQS